MTRQLPALVAVAAAAMLIAGCDSNGGGTGTTSSWTAPSSSTKQALPPGSLQDLLLSETDVDGVLGVTGSRTDKVSDSLQEDPTAGVGPPGFRFPDECLYITGPGLARCIPTAGTPGFAGRESASPRPSQMVRPLTQTNTW
ncbi:hypothetical protein [Mycobacterium stomatepiae]|uniref:Uncharacterized protein n=1 Tax=Mycobacterium stomatepiae TaxID=470076 RepID=A0A7I7Q0Z9_9MYCO|nr:hypothetical protein [Mycobacterium stomatepiae]BBY19811.1 hypothetical protein MSTO_00160 [Mycobacterium stomatepiae]BBY25886.1 hypothetical protein MSTO_60910 [Mycobacterium stomatepiae]